MAKTIELTASDGQRLSAYVAEPTGQPRGAIVVVQEIFGVTRVPSSPWIEALNSCIATSADPT
jgi:dienelactone hydrolase